MPRQGKGCPFALACVAIAFSSPAEVHADSKFSYTLSESRVFTGDPNLAETYGPVRVGVGSPLANLVMDLPASSSELVMLDDSSESDSPFLTAAIHRSFPLPRLAAISSRSSTELAEDLQDSLRNAPRMDRPVEDRPWMLADRSSWSGSSGGLETIDPKAVPEPASLLLLLTGWLGLMARRRLRKSSDT